MERRHAHLPSERWLWVALMALIALAAALRLGPSRIAARLERGKAAAAQDDASRFAISFFQSLRDNDSAAIGGYLGSAPKRVELEYTLLCDMDAFRDAQDIRLRDAPSERDNRAFAGTIRTSFGYDLRVECDLSRESGHWVIAGLRVADPDVVRGGRSIGPHKFDFNGPAGEVADAEGKELAPQIARLLSSTEFRQRVIDDCNLGGWISPDLLSHLYSTSSSNSGATTKFQIATQDQLN